MKRESKYELLRIILILMVISLHYLNPEMGGALEHTKISDINYVLARFFESISIIAVNVFVLIAGYFGCNRMTQSLRKPLSLVSWVIFYNIIFQISAIVMKEKEFSLKSVLGTFIPSNWYIVLYCSLTLIAPYINYLINNISEKQFQVLLGVIAVVFSVWNTMFEMASTFFNINLLGVSTVSISGSQAGYNIVNFIFLYVIGSYMRKYSISIKKGYLIAIYICALCVTVVLSGHSGASWNYDNIFVIIMSISFFALWGRGITLGYKRGVNVIAKGTLGIYIIHTKGFITNGLWGYFKIREASQGVPLLFILNILGCVFVTYIVCYTIENVCRWCIKPISNYLDKCAMLNKNIIQLVTEEK